MKFVSTWFINVPKEEMIKNATIITAAIFGVDLLCIDEVEAVETSEAEEMEGVDSFPRPIFTRCKKSATPYSRVHMLKSIK